MREPRVRATVRTPTATIGGGRDAPHLERPARPLPGRDRRQDRATRGAPAGRGRRGARGPADDLRDDPRQPVARAAERRPAELLAWGPRRYRVGRRGPGRPHLRERQLAVRPRRRSRSSPRGRLRRVVRVGRPLVERVVAPRARRAARASAASCSAGSRSGPAAAARDAGRSSPRALGRAAGLRGARRLVRRRGRVAPCWAGCVHVIVTVTLNAAIDRTLTVPNFQRGQRHRASPASTLAGGKGINVARALKRLACRSSRPASPAAAPARASSRS